MEDWPDKRRRKEALDKWKAQERATARAKLPLPDDKMRALFDTLDVELYEQQCDHTLRLVRRWCQEQGIPVEPVEAWLHETGGYCDCEVLANSEQQWQDAIHDVNW